MLNEIKDIFLNKGFAYSENYDAFADTQWNFRAFFFNTSNEGSYITVGGKFLTEVCEILTDNNFLIGAVHNRGKFTNKEGDITSREWILKITRR